MGLIPKAIKNISVTGNNSVNHIIYTGKTPFGVSFIVILLFLFCRKSLFAQPTPLQWFECQYTDAINYCYNNKSEIETTLRGCSLPAAQAISVVFPEMLRYTLWRDVFETKALELLYVQGGIKAADFSIGWFQMKPSFAEQIEKAISLNTGLSAAFSILLQYPTTDTSNNFIRRERVHRLKQLHWQLMYLNAFVALNNIRFTSDSISTNSKIKYLAAAYNRGMEKSISELESFLKLKTFPYGPGEDNPFSYAGVAEYFYLNDALKIFK